MHLMLYGDISGPFEDVSMTKMLMLMLMMATKMMVILPMMVVEVTMTI